MKLKEKNDNEEICRSCYYKTNKKKYYLIKYSDIKFIMKRYYLYEYQSMEIYTETKSYFFEFENEKQRDLFIKKLLEKVNLNPIKNNIKKNKENPNINIIGYFNSENKSISYINDYENIIKEWQTNNISTFHYLMLSNILGNRSLNDLTQYPIFPWIITNFDITPLKPSKEEKLTKEKIINNYIRDFSLPIGLMELTERGKIRKENYINTYKMNLEEKI